MAFSFKKDLRRAYKAAKRELNDVLLKQQQIEKDIVIARQTLQNLGSVCEAVGVRVESSSEAAYLLQKSALGDEVRSILTANYPAWTRPNQVLAELERIGHDLSKLSNPQASIQMILKRMVESGEAREETWPEDGKKIYRMPRIPQDTENPQARMTVATVPERGRMMRLSDLMGDTASMSIGRALERIEYDKLPEEIRAMLGHPKRDAIYKLADGVEKTLNRKRH
jgi:hypothetical protein